MEIIYYNFRYDIAAAILTGILLARFLLSKKVPTNVSKCFTLLTIIVFFASVFDVLSCIHLQYGSGVPNFVHYIFLICFYITFESIPLIFCVLVILMTIEDIGRYKVQLRFLTIPFVIALILIFISPFNGCLFRMDELGRYSSGYLKFYLYLQTGLYVFIALVHFLCNYNQFSKSQVFTLLFYSSLCLASVIVQLLIQSLMIMNITISISILIGFLAFENPITYIDPESGAYNREALVRLGSQIIKPKKKVHALGITIFNLKFLMDRIGSENSHLLLQLINSKLSEICKKTKVFRTSTSKFVAILDKEDDKQKQQLKEITELFANPFIINNTDYVLTPIMTLIRTPEDTTTVNGVLDFLDNSEKKINFAGNNEILRPDINLSLQRQRKSRILEILNHVVPSKDFEVMYQPIFNIKENKFTSIEALLRFKRNDSKLGNIGPKEFIPVAEENGLINEIGMFVLEEAAKFISYVDFHEKGLQKLDVNISVLQMLQDNFAQTVIDIFKKHNADLKLLNLEIKESSLLPSLYNIQDNMKKLCENGVTFTLDGYGEGLSHAKNILDYNFTGVKLDLNLITPDLNNTKEKIILNNSIKMLKDLDFIVVALGIESPEQAEYIKNINIDMIQGFYYTKPLVLPLLMEFLS